MTLLGEEKALLRSDLRGRLRALPPELRREGGEGVARALCPLLEALARRSPGAGVALFASLPTEIPTAPLFELLGALGLVPVLPAVEGGELHFRSLHPPLTLDTLPRDRMGIPTPPHGAPDFPLEGCGLVLVPGLAFDPGGGRLGRGKGYYDRALRRMRLAPLPPPAIGVGFDLQRIPHVPTSPEDTPLDALCTPSGGVEWISSPR